MGSGVGGDSSGGLGGFESDKARADATDEPLEGDHDLGQTILSEHDHLGYGLGYADFYPVHNEAQRQVFENGAPIIISKTQDTEQIARSLVLGLELLANHMVADVAYVDESGRKFVSDEILERWLGVAHIRDDLRKIMSRSEILEQPTETQQ